VPSAGPFDQRAEHDDGDTAVAMRGLFGRDAVYLLVWASQVGFAALSIPITTRLLGRNGFGVVTTTIAVAQVLVAIGVFSLPTAIQRNYDETDGAADSRRIISLSIITAGITLAVFLAAGPYWSRLLGLGHFGATLEYAAIWASLTAVTYAALALLRSRNTLLAYGLVALIQSVLAEIFSVLLIVFVRRDATEFILGEMIAQVVAVGVALWFTRPLPLRRRDAPMVSAALRYSGALVPAALAGFLLTASDRIVIHHVLGLHQVARYGAVYNLAAIPVLLLGLLDTVWLPRFFQVSDQTVVGRLLAESRDALYRLLLPVVLALSLIIPMVLSVWLSSAYDPGGLFLVVVTISLSAFPMAGYLTANRVLLISGRTVPVGVCMVLAAAFNIVANLVLVPAIGIEGSAVATLLAFILLQGLTTFFAHRIQPVRHPPLGLVALCVADAGLAAACTQVPSGGAFAAARVLLALICLIVFGAMLQGLIASDGQPSLLRAVGRVTSRK